MQSMGRTFPFMLLLPLSFVHGSSATDAAPCADYPNLAMIIQLASECLAACPAVCSPLSEAVALSLGGGDPLPVVCARQDTFACITGPTNHNICGEMLQTANSVGITVPLTTVAMEEVCQNPTRTTAQTSRTPSFASCTGVWLLLAVVAMACGGPWLGYK
mmetsp:Transcript_3582/g.8433  ORF Transcript_3582/g.8433 Transcript_3582/m.8433 type:complete len:160 (-) Transcript_3582:153-632(-)